MELIFGGMHAFFTVLGILRFQQSAVRLDEEVTLEGETNDKIDAVYVIPPPSRPESIKLGIAAAVLSLAASLPLNFLPKWPL